MAVNDFKSNLIQFGKSIYILGIIYIINLLYSFFSLNIILDLFFNLFFIIMNFIIMVYAVNKIISLNNIFHSEYINSYRTNMLISSIIKLISTIFLVVFLFINAETILEMSNEIMNFDVENASDEEIGIFLLPIIPIVQTTFQILFIQWISYIFEYQGMKKLILFFQQNAQFFPGRIGIKTTQGAKSLKNAALMQVLSFLLFPIFFSWVYYIQGYFTLGGILKNVEREDIETPNEYSSENINHEPYLQDEEEIILPEIQQTEISSKFCGGCGIPIESKALRFCPNCGFRLKK